MNAERIRQLIMRGENVAVEFKRGGNGIEHDAYETVCAFLNRFGGDILFGVEDDGTVRGVSPNNVPFIARSFVNTISNFELFSSTVYLEPEITDVCPAYEINALLRKVNVDRYDDREIVRTKCILNFMA